jgi:choline kinase
VVRPYPRPFDAIILAGGRGTRMGGADKPGLVVGGQTLLSSVLAAAAAAGAEPPPWLDCDTPEDLSRARAWSEQEASQ